jgi:hypothetical protein
MGITLKTVSVKWDNETVRMSDELQASFAPFIEGRSQLVRLAISILHKIVSTSGTVHVVTQHLQGLPCITSSPAPLQPAKVPTSFFPRLQLKAFAHQVAAQVSPRAGEKGAASGIAAPSHSSHYEFEELLRKAAGVN